ncbi:MAG: protein-glutamate O-methyltransferase CheR [bacterium]|nr:MAG: protein-glutamate O-methyltransferase CheR [bacterium]
MVAGRASEIGHLPEKDAWAFEAIKELLMSEVGFDLEAYKERCILRRIYLKVRSGGYSDLGSYYRILKRDRDELEHLVQYLTINVTEFFRNAAAFTYLEKKILPALMLQHSVHKSLNVWSAGCSSGEEPYSIAISLLRVRRKHRIRTPFRVLATDVDKVILARGREGNYSRDALKNLEERDLKDFFVEDGNGYRVSEELRQHVTFRVSDVLVDRPGRLQSLILCRNLLIYFSREKQERVITGFSRAMHPGGYLMLGKAETLIGMNRLYFQSISPTERIYRLRDVPLADSRTEPIL